MLRSKYKEDKDTFGLLENQNNDRVVSQHWIPRSKVLTYTPRKQPPNQNPFLHKDQWPFPAGGGKPERKNWITFATDNPFDEDQSFSESWSQIEGNQTRLNTSHPLNGTRPKTQMAPTLQFSYDNPFIDPGTHLGNPFIDKTKITAKRKPEFCPVHYQSQNSPFDPIQGDNPYGNLRMFNRASASTQFPSPRKKQWNQAEFLNQLESGNTPVPAVKKSSFLFAGDSSDSTSSEESNKSSSNEYASMKMINKGTGSTTDKFKHKKIKKYQQSVPDDNAHSNGPRKNLIVRQKSLPPSLIKKQKKCLPQRTEALAELFRGTTLLKFPRRRGKAPPHFKFFQLARSKTSLYLQWFSKRKTLKETTINIAEMDGVFHGKQSYVYIRHMEDELSSKAISIIYKKNRSVDVVTKSIDECTMWYKCLRELVRRAKLGVSLTSIQRVWIKGLSYVDSNRPKREQNKVIMRANMLSQRDKDARIDKSNKSAVERFEKRVTNLIKLSKSGDVRNSDDHVNLMLSVASIQDRLGELRVETRESMNSSRSKSDIWRLNIDLKSLEEKVQVLRKNKNFHLI